MISFKSTIKKFGSQGEKTGWSYLEVPAKYAEQINPGVKKSYRVKGRLDNFLIKQVALLPMGEGDFIIPLNNEIRKGIKKAIGATVILQLTEDKKQFELNAELMECLKDEPKALKYFKSLAPSHQRYFSKWIDSAKTETTRTKRIVRTVNAMLKEQNYGTMLRNEEK
jgi:hypothetical protein